MSHEKFIYFELTNEDKAELEANFDSAGEYLVYTDETAERVVKGQILSMLWVFDPYFLAGETGLPAEVFSYMQEKLGSDCNDVILTLIRSTCGESKYVNSVVTSDGRGYFIATYDRDEQMFTTKSGKVVYVYRIN